MLLEMQSNPGMFLWEQRVHEGREKEGRGRKRCEIIAGDCMAGTCFISTPGNYEERVRAWEVWVMLDKASGSKKFSSLILNVMQEQGLVKHEL